MARIRMAGRRVLPGLLLQIASLAVFGPAFLALAAGVAFGATTFRVGPGHPYPTPGDVPWESLAPGDSVLIHARTQPYTNKWVLCRAGTQALPIVVRGVPDPTSGALPVIEGANATTRPALNFWNEDRGVIKIGGANSPPDLLPAWIVIENLDVRGGRPENSFTGRNGLTSYAGNAAAIYVEKGRNITVRGCHLHDCSNGLFAASGTSDFLVESNWIEDNGNVGSIYEHNNYTEALGITFQFNRFGPLRAGAGGNNLKDRSAGCVIRYNWIEGGNRQLDLVESDFATLVNDPKYRATFVYGNVLYEGTNDGNSQIVHYGGDGGVTANYRKGTLNFHHNTVVSKRTANTTLVRLSTADESADVRNNVLYVTATGNRLAFLESSGALVATRNWLKSGWVASHSGGSVLLTDAGQLTGSAPGFADFAAEVFELAAGSPCIGQAVALLPAVLPDHRPAFEYVKHQQSRARVNDGAADLGAYEQATTVDVPGEFPGSRPGRAGLVLEVTPHPVVREATVRVVLAPGTSLPPRIAQAPLELFDIRGRRVASVAATSPGVWSLNPAAGLPAGLYVIRAGNAARRIVLIAP